ncbi:MAG: hypothetical protein AB7L41_07120 [Flavobacteriaceae bacterium]
MTTFKAKRPDWPARGLAALTGWIFGAGRRGGPDGLDPHLMRDLGIEQWQLMAVPSRPSRR